MQFSREALSPQYVRLKQLGHTRPTPAFSPPALVKYVNIWPKRGAERHEIRDILAAHLGSDGITSTPRRKFRPL